MNPQGIKIPDSPNQQTTEFYSALLHAINSLTEVTRALGTKLDTLAKSHETVEDTVKEQQIRAQQTLKVVGVVWLVFGGVMTVYVKGTIDDVKSYIGRLEKLEKTAEMYQLVFKPHENLPDQVQAVKNRLNALEDDFTEMKRKERK